MRRAAWALGALLLAFGGPAAGLPERATRERPFPVDRSVILREERIAYIVEGTITIPPGVEISCQKDVHIIGRGTDPTIVVAGALKAHGVAARDVIFEDVTIRLAPEVRDVHLDSCTFRGSGGVVTTPEKPATGKLFIEGVSFLGSTVVDVAFARGSIDLSSVACSSTTHIAAAPRGEERGKVRLKIRAGNMGDLRVTGVDDVTVQLSRIAGTTTRFEDCGKLVFDGNKVNSATLAFVHSKPGGLMKVRVFNCDLYCKTVSARAPKEEGRGRDRVFIDKSWWLGVTDRRELHERVIRDAEDDEENGARIVLGKLHERATEIAGPLDR